MAEQYLSTDPNAGSDYLSTDPMAGFESTPGGAAVGNPIIASGRRLPLVGRGSAILGATGAGAAIGAIAPEVMTGAAGILRQIPAGARVAPIFEAGAIAAKSAGRPLTALQGAAAGLFGETAGQMVEGAGGGTLAAEGARLAGGAIGGEAAVFGRTIAHIRAKMPSLTWESMLKKTALRKVIAKVENDPASLNDREKAALTKYADDLRGGATDDAAIDRLYQRLEQGAGDILGASQKEADNVIQRAANTARSVEDAAKTAIGGRVTSARDRITRAGEDALAAAQSRRLGIADDADLTDIGTRLREPAFKRYQETKAQRSAEFDELSKKRDAIVSQRESAGQSIRDLPEFSKVVTDLERELAPGRNSSGVASTFRGLLSDIRPFVDGKEVPASFNAIDQVRRKLGEVFRGNPPEGYAAIDANTARTYYKKLTDLQKKFVDGNAEGPQSRLLSSYREGSENLDQFATRTGRKLTAVDRVDESKFVTDPASIPKSYFSSKQGVSDLVELTGNRNAVVDAAKQFAVNELRDKNSQQVRAWMTSRREMLSALPEVRNVISQYADTLDKGELVSRVSQKALKKLPAVEQNALAEAAGYGSRITKDAASRANAITKAAQSEADLLTGNKFPRDRIASLLEGGNRREWNAVAMQIANDPAARADLELSVRRIVADKAVKTVRGTLDAFERKMRPALETTGLMPKSVTADISAKLARMENLNIPEDQKLGMARRLLLTALAGNIAGKPGQAVSAVDNIINSLGQEQQ